MRTQTALSNDQLQKYAPSIFAAEPWHAMSDRYAFIPTIQVVEKLRAEGFVPVSAVQSRTRIAGKGAFTKHELRFRDVRNGNVPVLTHLGQLFAEIVLTNSHDGASAYKIDAALLRFACLNGLTIPAGEHQAISVRHSGQPDDIIEATFEVVEEFPKVLESAEKFHQLQLTAGEQTAFAESALALRYDEGHAPVAAAQILRPQRREDKAKTLWNTYNVVQEHLIKGGARGYNHQAHRRAKVRAVTGITESARLSKSLWRLTEHMAALKGGAS